MLVPDNECFKGNVVSTHNITEAARRSSAKKIIVASGETAYEVCFGQGDLDYHSFLLEEDHDVNPMDTYVISKLCGERTGFARRFDVDIYALRIGNVIEAHEHERDFPKYVNEPTCRKRNAWPYIDTRDLGQICGLCVQKNDLGFQVFSATNDTITTKIPSKEFLAKICPNTPIMRKMDQWQAPLSNRKIRYVLGLKEEHNWWMYYKP